MRELEEAYTLVEKAIGKASKELCSLRLTRHLERLRDDLDQACVLAEMEEDENGSKKKEPG